jgi:hypothetical protein
VPAVALLIALPISGGSPAPEVDRDWSGSAARLRAPPAREPTTTATRAAVQSLRAARGIANRQLGDADRELRGCAPGSPVSTLGWRDCVRWPLAHLAVDGRISGGVLYSIGQRGQLGHCREQALGEASGLRLLGGLSDEVVRGLASSSADATAETARSFAATRSLAHDLRHQLRRPLPAC